MREEVNKQSLDVRAAEQARDSLKNELSGESMQLIPDGDPPVAQSTSEFDARLDAQRRQLDELLRRYTEAHPDVIASRRLIARLEEQRQLGHRGPTQGRGQQATEVIKRKRMRSCNGSSLR